MDRPMFPLGSVVFPGQLLPLHIFEDRYRQMLDHCLRTSREFGVVLIERGSEVGGGDVRSSIGTLTSVLDASELEPGHWMVVTGGLRRIRVLRWYPDDPWPSAEVADLPDGPLADTVPQELRAVRQRLDDFATLATELGDENWPAVPELSDNPGLASFQLAALAPLGSFDRQTVLATVGVSARLNRLARLIDEAVDTLRATGGWSDPG